MRTPRRRPEPTAPGLRAPAGGGKGTGRRAHAGPPAEEPADGGAQRAGRQFRTGGTGRPRRPGPAPASGAAPASGPVPEPGPPYGSGPAAAATGSGPDRPRGRRPGLRPATVRAKIVSLLMVPVVSLLALWAFATVNTAQDMAGLGRVQRADAGIRAPVAAAVAELQAERRAAVRLLADPAADPAGLDRQARRTDDAVRALRLGESHTVADSGDYDSETAVRLGAFVVAAEGLASARKDVTGRRATPEAAVAIYTRVVDSAFAVGGSLTGGGDAVLGPDARVLLEFARAAELLSREDALLAVPGPRSAETLRQLTGTVEARRALTESASRDLPEDQRAAWQAVAKSAAYADLTGAEDRALSAGAAKEVRGAPTGWEAAHDDIGASMREIAAAAHTAAAERSDPVAEGAFGPDGAAVLFGLLAVCASLVISVRIGRVLVVELVSLRDSALEIAHRKLPLAMDRLRAGEDIDIAAEAPHGPPAEDEITQVGEALGTVHRAALDAAVERAELAGGVSGVFVNLARRSQVLVHRQLALLDSMERRADDPGELGDLFRLDHLTTRMRRHAESLIILSGASPGRAWRMPVPLTNVVRAAVSEIEDYPRVEVRGLAEAAVTGGAVADLTHLLAELIENATQFSPPHTKVRVSGEPVGTGYVLEVEDRGLGMGRSTMAEANRRIEQSESLDLFDSDRLGLFVVSRLSARHGVKVHLRTSPYGGTTAVVLLPHSLLQGALTAGSPEDAAASDPEPGPGAGSGRTASAPRPAGGAPAQPRQPAVTVVRGDARGALPRDPHSAPVPAPGKGGGAGAATSAPGAAAQPRSAPVAPLRPRTPGGALARTPADGAPASAADRVPVSPVSPASPAAADRSGASVTELPRRVRQASLVPQLRQAPEAKAPDGVRPPEDPPGRSPEQARDRMTAYRAGWVRGARENSPHSGSEGEL
ncbi:nitrate- and nitrite sensing domain-containing protein [Streptomyces sp. NPDC091201]|uniref:sensor histidine kinase n=1 Tax=Streptomyces sp. NPDC091201 TaxID=3155190 RepID=UPI003446EF8C